MGMNLQVFGMYLSFFLKIGLNKINPDIRNLFFQILILNLKNRSVSVSILYKKKNNDCHNYFNLIETYILDKTHRLDCPRVNKL